MVKLEITQFNPEAESNYEQVILTIDDGEIHCEDQDIAELAEGLAEFVPVSPAVVDRDLAIGERILEAISGADSAELVEHEEPELQDEVDY